MMFGVALLMVALQGPPATTSLSAADELRRRGEAAPAGSDEARRLFEAAVDSYDRIQAASTDPDVKAAALEATDRLYDAQHLANPSLEELTLRALSGLRPDDIGILFRLARVQEGARDLDGAENTLLGVRHARPDELAPNDQLARFYARRVSETKGDTPAAAPQPAADGPDADGYYRVGGAIPEPRRLDVPQYPAEAQDAGLAGMVVIELTLDGSGNTTAMRVVRSVPMLDESALDAVRHWHFDAATSEGQPVPAKVMITVSYSLRK